MWHGHFGMAGFLVVCVFKQQGVNMPPQELETLIAAAKAAKAKRDQEATADIVAAARQSKQQSCHLAEAERHRLSIRMGSLFDGRDPKELLESFELVGDSPETVHAVFAFRGLTFTFRLLRGQWVLQSGHDGESFSWQNDASEHFLIALDAISERVLQAAASKGRQ